MQQVTCDDRLQENYGVTYWMKFGFALHEDFVHSLVTLAQAGTLPMCHSRHTRLCMGLKQAVLSFTAYNTLHGSGEASCAHLVLLDVVLAS